MFSTHGPHVNRNRVAALKTLSNDAPIKTRFCFHFFSAQSPLIDLKYVSLLVSVELIDESRVVEFAQIMQVPQRERAHLLGFG